METVVFYVMASLLVLSALGVVTARSPLRGALSLIVSLCALAVLFVLLNASFLAAMQVMVYAGAIMVLFVFVIMLLNLGASGVSRPVFWSVSKTAGCLGVGYLGCCVVRGLWPLGSASATVVGTVREVGTVLLTRYVYAFESISMLLLVAVVGSVLLAQKRAS